MFLLNNMQMPMMPNEMINIQKQGKSTFDVLNKVKIFKETNSMIDMLRSIAMFQNCHADKIKSQTLAKL